MAPRGEHDGCGAQNQGCMQLGCWLACLLCPCDLRSTCDQPAVYLFCSILLLPATITQALCVSICSQSHTPHVTHSERQECLPLTLSPSMPLLLPIPTQALWVHHHPLFHFAPSHTSWLQLHRAQMDLPYASDFMDASLDPRRASQDLAAAEKEH